MTLLHRMRDSADRGSIPLALLTIIVTSALVGVLVARTVAEQRATRFDVEYTDALHAAEVGLEEALFDLNVEGPDDAATTGTTAVAEYEVIWEMEFDEDGRRWIVTSEATGPNDISRMVVAELRDRPLFETALATHLGVNFAGGNAADSYNGYDKTRCSLEFGNDSNPDTECFGTVASNGQIDMGSAGGTNNYADQVRVHDWANVNNRENRCSPTNSLYCSEPWRFNVDTPLDIKGMIPFVETLCPSYEEEWKASTHATGQGNNMKATLTLDPEVNCFERLTFDETTEIVGVTPDDPALVVVEEQIFIGSHVKVNCEKCGTNQMTDNDLPSARRFQLFILAEDQPSQGNNVLPAVQIRQHAKIGAAIYAPNASCGNQQSNAQVEIFGSLVCHSVLNQGGWEFHYDEDLMEGITTEEFFVARWEER